MRGTQRRAGRTASGQRQVIRIECEAILLLQVAFKDIM